MNKATHSGTCQVCGRGQKLPGGKLSKHGYTVNWGFFSGTCWGADHLPFEQDTSLIQSAIGNAEALSVSHAASSTELKGGKQLDDNKAWYRVYAGANSRAEHARMGGYRWEQVKIERVQNPTFIEWFYVRYNGKRERLQIYRYDKPSLDEVRTDLNKKYAEQFHDKQVENLARYIAWQRERIKNWKPSPLTPVK